MTSPDETPELIIDRLEARLREIESLLASLPADIASAFNCAVSKGGES